MLTCPKCGAVVAEGDRFCEIDGTPLIAARSDAVGCARCGAQGPGEGGYCASCGHKLAPGAGGAAEIAIAVEELPSLASAIHPGLRRGHNEDAVTIAGGTTPRGERFHVLVVCDGVSSSTRAEQASSIAARAVRDALAHFCRSGDVAFESVRGAVGEAIRDAHIAVCVQGIDHGTDEPPGTTCVAALVVGDRLVVGWAGDSRAYWLTEQGAEQLTRDHSWVNEVVASGQATLEEAMQSPEAHALTRCLGPLETETGPIDADVIARRLGAPGVLLLCSDGLWNYYADGAAMHDLVRHHPPGEPAGLARYLVKRALDRGGADNVSVAVYAHDRRT